MKIGIIGEFNPFHNGHKYFIDKIKEKYPNSFIILVMSGNFTQRGIPSIYDKWDKSEIVLNNGVDLVVELPFVFATQSADYFAKGSIEILNYLGVDKIIFGSESNDIDTLKEIAKIQNNDSFDTLVKLYCKNGYNYPTALSMAIEESIGKKITTPNDLLGISYIKEIINNNYDIEIDTIKRTNDYHDTNIDDNISSATAIREAIKNNIDYTNQVPKNSLKYYNDLHFIDDYYDILKYKIITEDDLYKYQTVSLDIIPKLKKEILNVNSIDELIKRVKSKNDTYNKISRMILHILVNFTKEKAKSFTKINYIRVLGFNNNGKVYLNKIKKDVKVPLVTSYKNNNSEVLNIEYRVTNIYSLIVNDTNLIEREKEKPIIR